MARTNPKQSFAWPSLPRNSDPTGTQWVRVIKSLGKYRSVFVYCLLAEVVLTSHSMSMGRFGEMILPIYLFWPKYLENKPLLNQAVGVISVTWFTMGTLAFLNAYDAIGSLYKDCDADVRANVFFTSFFRAASGSREKRFATEVRDLLRVPRAIRK